MCAQTSAYTASPFILPLPRHPRKCCSHGIVPECQSTGCWCCRAERCRQAPPSTLKSAPTRPSTCPMTTHLVNPSTAYTHRYGLSRKKPTSHHSRLQIAIPSRHSHLTNPHLICSSPKYFVRPKKASPRVPFAPASVEMQAFQPTTKALYGRSVASQPLFSSLAG